MSERSTVSVLLPVHRVDESVFALALRSVLLQSRPVDQLVVVDDSGEGAHESVVRRIVACTGNSCTLTYIQNSSNKGLVDSLNIGLAACHGDVVARMDADDIALPHRIETQLALITRGYDLVGGGIIKFGQQGLHPVRYPTCRLGLLVAFMRSSPFAHPAVMFCRERILALGGYRDFPYAEDLDLWVRCLAAGVQMSNVSLPVLMYRQHAQQVSVINRQTQLSTAKLIRSRVVSALWTRWSRWAHYTVGV
jgi:glycosyltransferase involved in cell wall biosynthesis